MTYSRLLMLLRNDDSNKKSETVFFLVCVESSIQSCPITRWRTLGKKYWLIWMICRICDLTTAVASLKCYKTWHLSYFEYHKSVIVNKQIIVKRRPWNVGNHASVILNNEMCSNWSTRISFDTSAPLRILHRPNCSSFWNWQEAEIWPSFCKGS